MALPVPLLQPLLALAGVWIASAVASKLAGVAVAVDPLGDAADRLAREEADALAPGDFYG